MNTMITKRLEALRRGMREKRADLLVIPTADPHQSEYVGAHFMARAYYSGFDGSAGTLVVSADKAGLWTDGRYFVQAEAQLEGTGIELFRMGEPGVPTIPAYLKENLPQGGCIAVDGRCIPLSEGRIFAKIAADKGGRLLSSEDIAGEAWEDRPRRSATPVYELPETLTGESFATRIARVREEMTSAGAGSLILTKLDDLMWLTNLRASDVECNPVSLSYGLVQSDRFDLFIQEEALSEAMRDRITEQGILLHDYDEFIRFLGEASIALPILVDPQTCGYRYLEILRDRFGEARSAILPKNCPITLMKAVKNETELANIREIYIEDSAAVCHFIYDMETSAPIEEMTEYDAAMLMDGYRRQISDFIELSFPTISAYGTNGAIVHYDPVPETAAKLERKGMLLVDCGGTYRRGTTDVTRTIALGPVTPEEIHSYTLTLAGQITLQNAVFLEGCTGRNLDILARQRMWEEMVDYKHGTGHGIGFVLNVHEGPQSLRWQYTGAKETVFRPGMIVSDEPGIYIKDKYGIRIESIVECVKKGENGDGVFLAFKPLTYVPMDRRLIDPSILTSREKDMINEYHRQVLEKMTPFMRDADELAWLTRQCANLE